MMQFFGTYKHKLDAKGRVALPSKFRKSYDKAVTLGDISSIDLVIVPSPTKSDESHNECLYVFTIDDYDKWVKSFFEVEGGYNPRNKKHEMQMWALHANVEDVSIDASGRINIPNKFREKAGLKTEVSIVGNSGHFEIWDTELMESKLSEINLEDLLYDK